MPNTHDDSRPIALLRRVRLQSRLPAACLLLALIPMLVVGLYAYRVYTRSIIQNLSQAAEQAVQLLSTTVVSELGKFGAYINTISVSDSVQEILIRPEAERVLPDGSVAFAIKQHVQEIPAQSRYLKNIRIVDRAYNVLYDLGFDDILPAQFARLLSGVDAASPNDSLQYVRTYRGVDTLVLGRKIHQFARPRVPIGYILVYIDEKLLSENVFDNIDFGAGSNILLMGGNGQVLSSGDKSLLGAHPDDHAALLAGMEQARLAGSSTLHTAVDGAAQLVVFDYDAALDTYFAATIPRAYITAQTRQITANLLLVATITGIISLALAMLLYRSIIRPIRRIVDFCGEATQSKIDRHIEDGSPDELGYLARSVDRFVHEIQALLQKSKLDSRRKRALELEMLQYQINPHFLFNTLNTLQWVAALNEVPVLEEGISSLSKLLQSTLLGKDESVPIAQELQNVRHYVSIQKIRYADCFAVRYAVEPGVEAVRVPRFILQPLVENAILHGTRDGGDGLWIDIACRRDANGNVLLAVEDNGQGFDTEFSGPPSRERFSGIGLANVQERLQLSYGAHYGLQVESVPGQGTRCLITIPTGMPMEEAKDATCNAGG